MIRKQLLLPLLVVVALLPTITFAQKVDTVEVDGKDVFVYPFKIPAEQTDYYWNAMDQKKLMESRMSYDNYLEEQRERNTPDSLTFTPTEFDSIVKAFTAKTYSKFNRYYIPKMGPAPTRMEFKRYIKGRNKRRRLRGMYEESRYFYKKKFIKAVRENPYEFLVQNISMEQDLTPMLDPIPDGQYIQYYETFCMLQLDGSCEMISDQIAGYFTIKNNVLQGEATWVGMLGDTLKHGWFDQGLKVGEWTHLRQSRAYMEEEQARHFVEYGFIYRDTTFTVTNFKNGVKQGSFKQLAGSDIMEEEGTYDDGEQVGEWRIWWEYMALSSTDSTLDYSIKHHYTLNGDDTLVVHPTMVRNGLYDPWEQDYIDYNFFPDYEIPSLPKIYEPAFALEENLDLDEEFEFSYEDEEFGYYEDMYYEDYEYNYGYDNYLEHGDLRTNFDDDPVYYDDGKEKLRSLVFDSLGAYPLFEDVLESYYPNGQLAYRYEFEDGLVKSEPTIYWDNGTVHDIVTFIPDSNHYERKIYDYQGLEYRTLYYDSVGNRKITKNYFDEWEPVVIEGHEVYYSSYGSTYNYVISDSLLGLGLDGETLIEKAWRINDTTLVHERHFDPNSFEGGSTYYNVLGGVHFESESTFSENYESWTGNAVNTLGDFEIRSIRSASIGEWTEPDSIPILMLTQYNKYSVDTDETLYYKDEIFNGKMKFDFRGKKFSISRNKMVFPIGNAAEERMSKILLAYRLKGKIKNREVLEAYPNSHRGYEGYLGLYSDVFSSMLSYEMQAPYYSYYEYDWDGDRIKKEDQEPFAHYIEGYFQNGKPEGKWEMYDQFGKVMIEASFHKGELDGKVLKYAYEDAADEFYYYDEMETDTVPEKRTYYLESEYNYENGKRNGKSYRYDWLGRIVNEENYEDGYQEGLSIESNHLATSMSEFKNGYRDGYSRTYLTLEGKDSILLYDLNFQNGLLQGESKSYHTNGNISKRGFFLSGQPIEDYEAYDSLGFRYHYVKFQYSYPIEEKLWEENELSVRYQFNWEDSIPFAPMDITESESLEALLVESGLSYGWEYQPYYGRQAIVDKEGVDYHLTKYYPNDTVSRDGAMVNGRKSGHWDFFSYDGEKLYEVEYFDSVLVLNDSVKFKTKGIYTELDADGNALHRSYIIEKSERFDCSHKDHYEVRQFYTIWEAHDSLKRMNGEVFNFYDNGTLQSYGTMKDGIPNGAWRYYDPAGKLNKYGLYVQGKRDGRWLSGDLSKTKYLGDICLNPNMPDIEEELRFRENFLDIEVINYVMGSARHHEYYDINMNRFIEVDEETDEEIIEE